MNGRCTRLKLLLDDQKRPAISPVLAGTVLLPLLACDADRLPFLKEILRSPLVKLKTEVQQEFRVRRALSGMFPRFILHRLLLITLYQNWKKDMNAEGGGGLKPDEELFLGEPKCSLHGASGAERADNDPDPISLAACPVGLYQFSRYVRRALPSLL